MKQTSNAQRPTPNVERSEHSTLGVERSALDVGRFLWRILDFVVAGIFIFAGITKILDLDHLFADLQHLRVANAFADLGQLSLANPAQFASDIDNFKLLPWPVSVALAFYLPWLEIFCALGLVFRFLYRGALSILSASIVVFTLAHHCGKSSRTRHHLRLFRSRQPTLEFPGASRNESCNSRRVARAFIQGDVSK